MIADNANDALVVRVTGSRAAAASWVATVRTAEVSFNCAGAAESFKIFVGSRPNFLKEMAVESQYSR